MDALLQTFREFGRAKLIMMALVAVVMIGGFAAIAMRVASPALSPIYTGLSPEESAKIITELGKLGVPFETTNNGSEIKVPTERMLRLRMTLAEMGLPSNGSVVGYEIFDRADTFGSSTFVMNVNLIRALEGELARTIKAFNQVESARVHLVVPKRELFNKNQQDPTASVTLQLRGGQELSKQEVAAITHLVAAAVPGLRVSRVTVVDSYGRLLARGDGQETTGAVAAASEEYRTGYELRLRDTLESLVERVVGPGSVKVQVAAEINFDRVETSTEKFDPDGQVVRSVQSVSERDQSADGDTAGEVTAGNQQPGAQAETAGGGNGKKDTERTDEITNYEISKTMERQVREGGTVKRLSVAVLVDGTYEGEGDAKTYKPLPEEDVKRIEDLVKSSIGFDEKRGDTVQVVNLPFKHRGGEATEEGGSFLAQLLPEVQGVIQTLLISVVAILGILVVLRPAVLHLMKSTGGGAVRTQDGMMAIPGPEGEASQQILMRLPGAADGGGGGMGGGPTIVEEEDDDMIDLENIKGRVKSSSLRKVRDFVDKNPDEAMNVVRQWMVREAS